MIEHLTFLLHTRKGQSSILGPETGYPDWVILLYFSVPPDERQDSTLN
jgi:hypothetical protein